MAFFKGDGDKDGGGQVGLVPLLPLRDIVVFPHMVVPLFVGREKSVRALERAMAGDRTLLLAAQKDAKSDDPGREEIFEVGTLGSIVQLVRLPDGTVKVLVEGKRRARVVDWGANDEFLGVRVELLEEPDEASVETEALMRSVNTAFED